MCGEEQCGAGIKRTVSHYGVVAVPLPSLARLSVWLCVLIVCVQVTTQKTCGFDHKI